jgi:hypothetical protein
MLFDGLIENNLLLLHYLIVDLKQMMIHHCHLVVKYDEVGVIGMNH